MFSDEEKAHIFHALSALLRCELYKVPPTEETTYMRQALLERSEEMQAHALVLDGQVAKEEGEVH